MYKIKISILVYRTAERTTRSGMSAPGGPQNQQRERKTVRSQLNKRLKIGSKEDMEVAMVLYEENNGDLNWTTDELIFNSVQMRDDESVRSQLNKRLKIGSQEDMEVAMVLYEENNFDLNWTIDELLFNSVQMRE